MFHKYNSFTNTLSSADQISAYVPQSFGTKEATNNFFVAPQPKGRQPGGSGPDSKGSIAGRRMSLFRFLSNKSGSSAPSLASTAQSVAAAASQGVANVAQTAASSIQAATSSATTAATTAAHNAASTIQAAASAATTAAHGHGHGHGSHAAPWEGVNLWRTPYKGNADTITQVKRSKGTLDKYVENRTRQIQQLQLFALRNKTKPTWVMMPRDKLFFAVEGLIVGYVLYQVTSTVYNHLKAKDRLKLLKLLYKDNVD